VPVKETEKVPLMGKRIGAVNEWKEKRCPELGETIEVP
jgi:hypothetical protein